MPLHLLKLCVGADSIRDLESWIAERLAGMRERGEKPERFHTTRMVPKRAAELLDGGSLYWVIRGQVAARETLLDIRPFTGAEGIHRCKLVLDSKVVPVMPRPYRAFQGWRYSARTRRRRISAQAPPRSPTCRRQCGANYASSGSSTEPISHKRDLLFAARRTI
jgi:hypothetical protein